MIVLKVIIDLPFYWKNVATFYSCICTAMTELFPSPITRDDQSPSSEYIKENKKIITVFTLIEILFVYRNIL